MNILITGSSGFLGLNLNSFLRKQHKIFFSNRQKLNLLDQRAVRDFFLKNQIDIVLHTAIVGGNRVDDNDYGCFLANLAMFDNLYENKHKFGKMINFCSGAAYDRSKRISLAGEREILTNIPKDFYGLAKNLIARKARYDDKNIYNLRLFGCFGHNEPDHRLIKTAIRSIINSDSITIHDDIYMDYFYVKDVCTVVDHYINNDNVPRDINLVYEEKKKLSDMIEILFKESGKSTKVIVEQKSKNCYNGDAEKINKLKLKLIGLNRGIKEVYEQEVRRNSEHIFRIY